MTNNHGTSHAADSQSSFSKDSTHAGEDFDCSAKVGPLPPDFYAEPREWPMYSFARPSWMLWNAIGRRLTARGWTEEEIKRWLQSKDVRWALDGSLGVAIEALGTITADSAEKVKA